MLTRFPVILQGKYVEADLLHLRAIDVVERTLDPDHPDIAARLGNRTSLLAKQVGSSTGFQEASRNVLLEVQMKSKFLQDGLVDVEDSCWSSRRLHACASHLVCHFLKRTSHLLTTHGKHVRLSHSISVQNHTRYGAWTGAFGYR